MRMNGQLWRWLSGLLIVAVSVAVLVGCATTRDAEESDMPWNTPADWEGVPAIPGFGQ
jgi:hypothetical protein